MTGTDNPYGDIGHDGSLNGGRNDGHDGGHNAGAAQNGQAQNGQPQDQSPYSANAQNQEYAEYAEYAAQPHYAQNQQYAQYPQYAAGWDAPQAGVARDAGFFSALFDFSFRKYATPSIVKIVYVLITVVMSVGVVVWALAALISAFATDAGFGIMALIVGIPVVLVLFVLQLALFRMLLEAGLALVRAAQSLQNLEQRR
ncbi:DUF4282 domain-containing protein [Corynebacterium sp. NPDC060344]|uniref:DUF4282 domain-containing protein n=1 Tax=Corynebacterium sp. NPDC060344 TaxID=3347101 RepID=UPI00365A6104